MPDPFGIQLLWIPPACACPGLPWALTNVIFFQITEPLIVHHLWEDEILVTQVCFTPCPGGRCCWLWAACSWLCPRRGPGDGER